MKTIFSPSTSYQILDSIEEEIEVMVVQMMVEKQMVHPMKIIHNLLNWNTKQSTKRRSLKTPKTTINVFKMFDWVTKEGRPHIPKKRSKEDVIKKTSSSNTANKVFGRELFKLFLQNP